MPRHLLAVTVTLVGAVLLLTGLLAGLVGRGTDGPPLDAVLDGPDRRALGALPLRRGADPPAAGLAVDLTDPAAVARAYLVAARSAEPVDHGHTRRAAVAYAAPGSPAAVGVVVLDPPPPDQVRTAAVTTLELAAAAGDDRRRGYRATVTTSTGPPGTTTVETEYVVLARQADGRWLVVADAPDVLDADV